MIETPRSTHQAFLPALRVLRGSLLFALALPAIAEPQRPSPLKSGVEFQSADVRKLQADDFANPGMLWVARGEAFWKQPRGEANIACGGCHAPGSMNGVAARYPRHDEALGRVVNLETRINACVTTKQKAPALAWESDDLLGISAYVSRQSRGVPISVSVEGPAKPVFEAGQRLYSQRIGQLHLACTNCHDTAWGRTLLAETISQGHSDGWPAYRLEWQSMGSIERRLRACFYGVRAEQPAFGSADLTALELYLAWREQGLPVSSPGVRR
jgi:sulfur-oxidizing protein SoxA